MAHDPKTLQDAILYFSKLENCIEYLAERRWPDGKVKCPLCGREGATYLPARRLWQCKTRHPKSQFSIKVGTIFEDSAIGLDKWLAAMWMISNCKNGASSWEIHRTIGVTQKTAWFMLHRIRLALKDDRTHKFGFGGPVESDEAFIGPNPQKMHRDRKAKLQTWNDAKGGYVAKTAVHGMLDRELRQVRARVLPNIKRETLQNAILDNVTPFAKVYTDEAVAYDGLNKNFVHKVINHSQEYVNGQVHTQGIENFWSLLKRTLRGTYVAVEPFHLDRYLDEQVFRYNNRATKDNPLTDGDRFALAVTQIVGKRLTYSELTGKDGEAPF
ncbi:MAG TPA: IS1595 family transposase [Terracidiphilus sp.]|nr:IS1595 family transposase [Terracidiphilus sp.]